MKYTFFSDPGHGWLEVPIREIDALGIRGEISSYSYYDRGLAFLEEDSDLLVFLRAKHSRGETVELRHVHEEHTPIRGFQSWEG